MNSKAKELKDKYEKALNRLEETNKKLREKIEVYINLEKDGNIGIKFIEMSAEQVVKKLKIICKESREIWKAFD
jgi:hypothetical protein